MALSLPAFAILLEVVVESEFPYVNQTVPLVAASFGLFLLAGIAIITLLIGELESLVLIAALGLIDFPGGPARPFLWPFP